MTSTKTRVPAARAKTATTKTIKAGAGKPGTKAPAPSTSKTDQLIDLLSRPAGATIDAMMKATDWQSHSVRGFLAGTVKKKLGKQVVSEKSDAGRIYRIVEGGAS